MEFHPDPSLQATAEKYVAGACTTLKKRLECLEARDRVLQKERESGETGLAKAEAAASEIRTEKAEQESEKRLKEEGIIHGSGGNGSLAGQKERTMEKESFEKDDVIAMDWEQVEKEQKDVGEMIQELKLKLEEYTNAALGKKTDSGSSTLNGSAKETLQQAINEALLGSSTNALGAPPLTNPNAPVNDLSAMVKKKKKVVEEPKTDGKRKEPSTFEERKLDSDSSKKAKVS